MWLTSACSDSDSILLDVRVRSRCWGRIQATPSTYWRYDPGAYGHYERLRTKCTRCEGVLRATGLFDVEDYVKEQQTYGGEDDVVAEEHLDPEHGIGIAGEDVAGGLDHGEQRGNENGEEDERE